MIGMIGTIIEIMLSLEERMWKHFRKASVLIEPVSAMYVKKNQITSNDIYPLFENFIDINEENDCFQYCETLIAITNPYDTEIVLDKIIFSANNIKIDKRPCFYFEFYKESDTGLPVHVYNVGFGNSTEITLKLIDKEGKLSEYIKREALNVTIPPLEASKDVYIELLNNKDVIKEALNPIVFETEFIVDNEDILLLDENLLCFQLEGKKLTLVGGLGADGGNIYGIRIDTNKQSYKREETVKEFIKPSETLMIPICFFPDKSCTLDFEIEFEVIKEGKKTSIKTGNVSYHFQTFSREGLGLMPTIEIPQNKYKLKPIHVHISTN